MTNTDLKNMIDVGADNAIAVTLDDLSEDDRREFEREVEEYMAEPSPSDLLGAEVKKPTDEIANLIDVSVASKYGSDITDMSRTITDRKSTRLNSSHSGESRMPSSA